MRELAAGVVMAVAACGRIGFADRGVVGGDAAAGADAAGPSGLIGWWKLDESSGLVAVDSAGTADGALTGDVTWEPNGGEIGGAALLANDGDIDLGKPAALANLPSFTVVAWLQPDDISPTSGESCFFDHGEPTAGWSFVMADETAGDLSFVVSYSADQMYRVSVSNEVSVGTWTRVAATWDGDDLSASVHIYVSGVEAAYADSADSAGPRTDDSMNEVAIGCVAAGGYPGSVDDVRIYNRVLAPSEIAGL